MIDNLPVELLSKIFALVCQSTEFHHEILEYTPPFRIGAICSSWRQLVWSLPSLWRYIYIKVSPEKASIQAELLEEWLYRSGKERLDIVLRLLDDVPSNSMISETGFDWRAYLEDPYAEPLFRIIARDCRRWKNVEFDIPNENCADILNHAWSDVGELQKLRVRVVGRGFIRVWLYEQANRLTHLSLSSFQPHSYFISPEAEHYINLTSLFLCKMKMKDAVTLFSGVSSTLKHLHLEAIIDDPFRDDNAPEGLDIDFPQLESLVMNTFSSIILKNFLQLSRPTAKLQKLGISLTERERNILSLPAIQQSLSDHHISLRALRIRLSAYHDKDLMVEELVNALMSMIHTHSSTLTELALEVQEPWVGHGNPNLHKFIKSFHHALDHKLPNLISYEFRVFAETFGPDCRPWYSDSRWDFLQPTIKAVQSWYKQQPEPSLVKLKLPNFERQRTMEALKGEVEMGLSLEFTGPWAAFSNTSQPTSYWYLE